MKSYLRLWPLLLLSCAPALHAQAISSIWVDNISHGSVRLNANTTAFSTTSQVLIIQQAHGSCASGASYDWIQPGTDNRGGNNLTDWIVGGLTANTAYFLCPQVWNGAWVTGQQIGFTTSALPAVHPALPIPPLAYNPPYPDTTGYATVDLTNNCTPDTFRNAFGTGSANQAAGKGTFILIPPGTTCSDNGQNGPGLYQGRYDIETDQPDFHNFGAADIHLDTGSQDSSWINTGNCCNTSGTANPISEGSMVEIAGTYNPGWPTIANPVGVGCKSGFHPGMHFFAHVLSNNTFSLYCDAGKNNGGSYVAITNAGGASCVSGGSCPGGSRFIWVVLPRQIPWIIVTNGVPDSQFVPFGARVNPTVALAMNGTFFRNFPSQGSGTTPSFMTIGNFDGGDARPTGHIWFRGMNFLNDWQEVSIDPWAINNTLYVPPMANDIVFDRVYWTYDGNTRCCSHTGLSMNGNNIEVIGSYFDHVQYGRYNYVGMNVSTGGNTITIPPGLAGMVMGSVRTTATATVTLGGAGNGTWLAMTDFLGGLDVALPPGITGSCSGPANCNVFTSDATGGIVNNPASGTYPAGSMGGTEVMVDPIFSTSAACTGQENVWGPFTPQAYNQTGGNSEWGFRFQVSRPGFICGMREWKDSTDATTTRSFHWWGSGNTILATATSSGEPAVGWITGMFPSPQAVSPGVTYVGSYTGAAGSTVSYVQNMNRNFGARSWVNGNSGSIMQYGYYAAWNNACNQDFNGPANWLGHGWAMPLACGSLTGPGSISLIANAQLGDGNTDFDSEGANFDAATVGPGPLNLTNNYTSGQGLIWHVMDSDGSFFNDFTIRRNYFTSPMSLLPGSPSSDGNYYVGRQHLEFKGGSRADINGNIFDGCLLSVSSGGCIETTPVYDTSSDHWMRNNLFMHTPACIMGPGGEPGGMRTSQNSRIWYTNNVCEDIDGLAYRTSGSGKTRRGSFIFEWYNNGEDIVVDHNTVLSQNGVTGEEFSPVSQKIEGVQITNNILMMNQGNSGWYPFTYTSLFGSPATSPCGNGTQNVEDSIVCLLTPNSVFQNNVLIPGNSNNDAAQSVPSPGGITQATVQSWFPQNHSNVSGNYIPASGNLTTFGFWNFNEAYTSNKVNGNPQNFNYRLKASSQACSGCAHKGTDGNDIGADIPSMNVGMGVVETWSVSNVTASTANVNFVAPDAAGCPVQYSKDPNFVNPRPLMVGDNGGGRARSIGLSGLAGATTYYVRINCQDVRGQPVTSFTTQ